MERSFRTEFLAVLKEEKNLGNICFSEQIFYRKQSLGFLAEYPRDISSFENCSTITYL